jgi:hypothetical protein
MDVGDTYITMLYTLTEYLYCISYMYIVQICKYINIQIVLRTYKCIFSLVTYMESVTEDPLAPALLAQYLINNLKKRCQFMFSEMLRAGRPQLFNPPPFFKYTLFLLHICMYVYIHMYNLIIYEGSRKVAYSDS